MVLERWRPSALRQWRPSRLMEDMERLMEESIANWPLRVTWRRLPGAEMAWAPALEMYEREDKIVVRTELPGVNKDEIDISMTGDTLTIKGERKASEEVKEEQYHRCELAYGTFSRSITMPVAVDAERIEATYENGILEIHVPKAKEAMPTRIQIKAM